MTILDVQIRSTYPHSHRTHSSFVSDLQHVLQVWARKLQVSGGIDNRRSLVFHFLGLQIVDVSKEGKEKHGKSKSIA